MTRKERWEREQLKRMMGQWASKGQAPSDWDYPWPKKIGPFLLDWSPRNPTHPLTASYTHEGNRATEDGKWVYMTADFEIDWEGGDTGFTIFYRGDAEAGEGDYVEYEVGPVEQNASRKTKEGAVDVVRRQVEAITRTNRKRLPDWIDTIRGTGLK